MSEKAVRQPLALKGRPTRGLEERLALRFPRATNSLAKAVWGLPQRSRIRRALIRRMVVLGWEAMNRVDLEIGLAFYHPDVESIYDPGMVALGVRNTRGREERRRLLTETYGEA